MLNVVKLQVDYTLYRRGQSLSPQTTWRNKLEGVVEAFTTTRVPKM